MRIAGWLFLFIVSAAVEADDWRYENVERVVAISDVHGAFDAMVATLTNADVIDDEANWAGGKTHLVVTGDLLDRGADSRKAMDLLIDLEPQAAAAGGAVHVLLGNHEVMNLMGDLRYVSAGEYAAFAGDETDSSRHKAFEHWSREHAGGDHLEQRAAFDKAYPHGYLAHREAFSDDGVYGQWLLGKPIVIVINETAFVHGGLSPMVAELGLAGLNEKLGDELRDYVRITGELEDAGVVSPVDSERVRLGKLQDLAGTTELTPESLAAARALLELAESDLNSPDGPLWYRGNVYCGRLTEQDKLAASLQAIGANRVIIGHTPTPDREVMQRFDGMVIEADTGMLSTHYGGSGHAVVINGDSIRVIGQDSRESLAPESHPRRVGSRPAALSAEALETLLLTGRPGEIREQPFDRNIVSVSDGTHTVNALFAERAGRGFYPDVAAYRLDRLIDLGQVPVAVVREVDGEDGSLQFLPDEWTDEEQRSASAQGGRAICPLPEQWQSMYVFDALIYNEGRSRQQMLYSTDDWQLLLVGHEKAFSTRSGMPRHLKQAPLDVNDAWMDAIARLDEAELEQSLGDVLDERRRRALLERRDELLERRQ